MRAAEFDREWVLRRAMEAFQANGYSKTTMQQLTQATGLHPGSLYCAFGNKRGLLLAAIECYSQDKNARRAKCFAGVSALTGLRHYLHMVAEDARASRCLVMRTLMELAEHDSDVAERMKGIVASTEQVLLESVQLAQQQHEIAADQDPQLLSQFLLINLQGLIQLASCGLTAEQAALHIERTLAALKLKGESP